VPAGLDQTSAVGVRQASGSDREALHELYGMFFAELATPGYWGVTLEAELVEVDEIVGAGLAFVAEEDEQLVGFALGRRKEGTRGLLSDIYVLPKSRRRGHGTRLARAVADALLERGASHITLSVHVENTPARAAYERWGFRQRTLTWRPPPRNSGNGCLNSASPRSGSGVADARAERRGGYPESGKASRHR
jgi:ribosomal protein S18 acetylase RimI-like enzyme